MLKRNTALLLLSLMSVIPLAAADAQNGDTKIKLVAFVMGNNLRKKDVESFAADLGTCGVEPIIVPAWEPVIIAERNDQKEGDFGGHNGSFARALRKGFNSRSKK